MNTRASSSAERGAGFTIFELLAVITLLSVLLAILLPALGGAREIARKAVCASNLHQFGVFVYGYANDHKRNLPPYPTGANKPITWQRQTKEAMLDDYGLAFDLFFCPSKTNYFPWTGTLDLATHEPGKFHMGYMNLMNVPGQPESLSMRRLPPKQPSGDLLIMADWMIKYVGGPDYVINHSSPLGGGYYVNVEPDGGNVLVHDGSVEWRDWSKVQVRFVRILDAIYW